MNALDPEAVVIGGGLGLVSSYREAAVAAARALIWAEDVRGIPIIPADLGGDGAILGAALAAPSSRAEVGSRGTTVAILQIRGYSGMRDADVAQLVEHITRNDGVRGSSPRVGSADTAKKSR